MKLVRVFVSLALYTSLAGAQLASPSSPGFTPVVSLQLGEAARGAAKTAIIWDVLPGEIPGISSSMLSLASGVTHHEPASDEQDRIYLVLSGEGAITVDGKEYPVTGETIAHFPVNSGEQVKAGGAPGLDILILRLSLTPSDREDLAAHPDLNRVAYVKEFKDCEPYGEAIKSAKTVSRTLLPKNIVPRVAIGTVETTGPDRVAPHRHPMLEQYFLGLEGNDITVVFDSLQTALKANDLFHIPGGSNHGAEVADGHKLYYVWMDFFQDRKGLEWLNEHKPLKPGVGP